MPFFGIPCCPSRRSQGAKPSEGGPPAIWLLIGTPSATQSVLQVREKIPALSLTHHDSAAPYPVMRPNVMAFNPDGGDSTAEAVRNAEFLARATGQDVLVDLSGASAPSLVEASLPSTVRTCLVYKPLLTIVEEAASRGGYSEIRRELLLFASLYRGIHVLQKGPSKNTNGPLLLQPFTLKDFHDLVRIAALGQQQSGESDPLMPASQQRGNLRAHAMKLKPILTFLKDRLGLAKITDSTITVWISPEPGLRIDKFIDIYATPLLAERMRAFIHEGKKNAENRSPAPMQPKAQFPLGNRLRATCLFARPTQMNPPTGPFQDCLLCEIHPRSAQALPITERVLASLSEDPPRYAGSNLMSLSSLTDVGSHVVDGARNLANNDDGQPIAPLVFPTPTGVAQSLFIYLHGLGGNGATAAEEIHFAQYQRSVLPSTLGVLPTAPMRPISLFLGTQQRGWFDVLAINFEETKEDFVGILESTQIVHQLIETYHQQFGIPYSKIVLAGFSQGGALSIYAGLTFPSTLGGIVCLSSYAPLQPRLRASVSSRTDGSSSWVPPPIYMAHGRGDLFIPFGYAMQSATFLRDLVGRDRLVTAEYPDLAHQISVQELDQMYAWVADRVR